MTEFETDGKNGDDLVVPPPVIDEIAPPHKAPHDIFFAAVKTTRMPMIVTDPHRDDNPIIFSNAAFEHMSGYSEAEILGRNCRFLQGPETDRDVVAQVRQAIVARREVSVEVLNYRKNGSTFWNALFVSPVYDDDGELVYFFASQLDVSRRREAEEALHQAQKMEAVGQLTGGIAHDFNNLLQVIIGYVDVLENRVPANDRGARRAVDAIAMAAQRGATLTQQLLAFARKQELRDRLLNFNTLIADFRAVMERTIGEGMELHVKPTEELWNCRVDPVQAEMALLNILSNARDATDGRGEVEIALNNVSIDGDGDRPKGVNNGEYVEIRITDRGPGIKEDAIDRIFDPFFSTKDVGKGTGLGLAMVYGFARQSGGAVTAENLPEGGASFRLLFPRSSGAPERISPQRSNAKDGDGERVLMVEDQPEVAALGKSLLEDMGYQVVQVARARDALDVLNADDDFRLLFTDIIMPGGMNGVELAHQVRRDFPKLQILLATGFSDDALDAQARAFELLRKPYRLQELKAKLSALLDKPGARA